MLKRQTAQSQAGEIQFRKKLSGQQIHGERVFDNEQDAEGIKQVLAERMEDTLQRMTEVRRQGFSLSPYLEIGAERCQRSLVMENDIGAKGAAADISFDMLKSCGHYGDIFGKSQIPLRICCDANRLPILTGSLPFAFCYQTLHHFPDPQPIVREIHRALAPGGCFFFDEEPYKRAFSTTLYTAKRSDSRKPSALVKVRSKLDLFFAKAHCTEAEYGIVENHHIPIRAWKRALGLFSSTRITLRSWKGVESPLYAPRSMRDFLRACLTGGSISGYCWKAGLRKPAAGSIVEILACPECLAQNKDRPLAPTNQAFVCEECGSRFPIIEGVAILFAQDQLRALYPEYC